MTVIFGLALGVCRITSASGADTEALLRAALQRLNEQSRQVAGHEAQVDAIAKEGMRRVDSALPYNNPVKGVFSGASAGVGSTVAASTASSSSSSGALKAGGCPTNLRHIASSLPRYNDSTLEYARNEVIEADLLDAFRQGRASGYSSSQIASLTVQQANAAKQSRNEAKQCFNSFTTDPQRVISAVENGTFQFTGSGSLTESCASSYVLSYYQMLANNEAAVAMACIARANP